MQPGTPLAPEKAGSARSRRAWPLLALAILVVLEGPTAHTMSAGLASGARNHPSLLVDLDWPEATAAPLTVELNVTPTLAEPGALTYDFCNVTGGAPPYRTVTLSTGDPSVPPTIAYNVSAPAYITGGEGYINAGRYVVTCAATDSAFATASASELVQIVPPPTVTVTASPSSAVPGAPVTFTVTPHNGAAPFVYLWMGLPPGCPYRNVPQVMCTPTVPGTWTVTVTVVDSLGASASNTTTATVTAWVLGMPQGEATLVLGGIVFAAVALVAFLIARRRKRNPPPTASAPETVPQSTSAAQRAKDGAAPSPSEPPPSRRETRSAAVRRAGLLGLFSALSAAFYLAFAWNFSFLTGFAPFGIGLLLLVLGGFVAVAAVRTLGFVLPLAGFVAGIALYYALAQPLSACTSNPAVAQGLGVPTCGAFALTAVGAIVAAGAIGAAVGVFLLRVSRIPRSERPVVALGTVVALLIASCAFAVTTPPAGPYPSNLGPDLLPFPLPAGSAFVLPFPIYEAAANFTFGYPSPQAFVPVAADGSNPAFLIGGWNATVAVCIDVQGFSYGGFGPMTQKGFYIACGTSVSFRVPLTPAVWQVAFSIRDMMVYRAEVTITQTIQVVY